MSSLDMTVTAVTDSPSRLAFLTHLHPFTAGCLSVLLLTTLYLAYKAVNFYVTSTKLNYQLRMIPNPPTRYPFSQFVDLISGTPWRVLGEWMDQLGDMIKFQFGTYTYIVVSNPDVINHVLMKITQYHKDLAAMKPFLVLLGNGLVTSKDTDEDKTWSKQRKLITPVLRSEVLDQTAEISIDATDRLIHKLQQHMHGEQGTIGICDEYRHLTLQVIGNSILSLSPQECSTTFPDLYLPIADEANARVYFPFRALIPSKQQFTYRAALAQLNTYIQSRIEQRYTQLQAALKANPTNPTEGRSIDILDRILIQLIKDNEAWTPSLIQALRDQIKTFVLAGHETTSMMLTWSTWELIQNPECMQKLKAEARKLWGDLKYNAATGSCSDTDKHPTKDEIDEGLMYTKSVLMEALRKWSVVPLVVREAQQDDVLPGNIAIPKGTCIAINIYQTHHDARYWPEPDRFDPERFVDLATNKPKPLPHLCAYLPFIQGPRNCVGQHFALLEAKIVLSRLVLLYDMETAVEEKGKYHKFNIPITPDERMKIHYRLRQQ